MITLTPSIRLKIASNLLSLNDDDLVLISGIIADIKNDKYKKVYRLVEELDGEEDFLRGGDNAMILIQTNNSLRKKSINRVLKISDDKLEEVINILEILNCSEFTNEDIKGIKWYLRGRLKGRLESDK